MYLVCIDDQEMFIPFSPSSFAVWTFRPHDIPFLAKGTPYVYSVDGDINQRSFFSSLEVGPWPKLGQSVAFF